MADFCQNCDVDVDPSVHRCGHGDQDQTWTTEQLKEAFEVKGFLAPFVVVKRKSDGQVGSLEFTHNPRLYYNWQPDAGAN